MSGHSKWATIKHKKAATDAKRGKIFTKIIRELTIAARTGGADPVTNPRLRTAILSAKGENMPNDNIERAIQRGTGTLEGETLDEVTFEGYGPGGVGVLVQVVTNNRNRIVSEIRHMFSKNGGNMAENGAVGWMFHRKGDIIVGKEAADEDKMLGIVLDAGAEDMRDDGAAWEVVTPPEAFEKVREALIAAGITPASAEVAFVPQNYVKLAGAQAAQMVRMMETLDEVTFEGYGPGGVGVLVQVVTNNRNRIVSEIRHMFSKNGGNMAENGAVGWMFHRKGDIIVGKEAADEDKMLGIVLDAGAEDMRDDGAAWEVVTPPEAFEKVREALIAAGITPASAEVAFVPQNYVKLAGAQAQQMLRMVETLEDHDDVQHVYANFDIDEKEMQAVAS